MKTDVNNKIIVNNYPYFLLSTYVVEHAEIDEDKQILYGAERSSVYEKAHPLFILFLKLIPFFITLPFLTIPSNSESVIVLCVAALFFVLIRSLYILGKIFLLKATIVISLIIVIVVSIYYPKIMIEEYFFVWIHYFTILLIFYVVSNDLFKNGYKQYYSLIDIEKEISGTVIKKGKRSFSKIPFTKKHLSFFAIKKDLGYRFYISGYFFYKKNDGVANESN